MSLTSAPSRNWRRWVEPLDSNPHNPNPYRRSWCEGDSNACEIFWESRHGHWDLVDYWLYLTAIEKKSQKREVRVSDSWLIESDGSRWENYGYAIDSDDRECQTGWKDPLVIFASLPIPHATGCPGRRIVLGLNLRTHRLLGYLFESAPESIPELGSVWGQRELIIYLEVNRFIQIVKHSIDESRHILTKGIFNYFRESNRHLHVGMDAVITVKYIEFLCDAIRSANRSSSSRVREVPSNLVDMEEHLRNFLCRGSTSAWMSSHRGVTTEDIRNGRRVMTSTDIFSDQLFPPDIVNDEKKSGRDSWAPMESNTSLLMRCEVDLPQIGLTSLKKIRQKTSDVVISLGIFGIEFSSLFKEEDCEVAPWVERMIQRRWDDQRRGSLDEESGLNY